jgi:hypothetical protein
MARTRTSKFDAPDAITNELIRIIERGVLPWRKPWTAGGSARPLRHNSEPYQGVNNFLLTMRTVMAGYTSPFWMTVPQANALDAKIRKGERSSVVVYYGQSRSQTDDDKEVDNTDTDEARVFRFQKSYRVFNADQIDGLPEAFHPDPCPLPDHPPAEPIPDMQAFFEESSSKKLMKTHQITLTLFMSYLEVYEHHVYENSRNWSNVKNIINNLHRNFMVFVEFITKNLTEEQYDAAVDWANKLQKVLCTRPVMKSHYNAYNSDLLENNNNMSISLLKDLLRKKAEETEYRKEAIFVLKNMQLVETPMVRDLMLRSITVTKNFQNEQLNGSSFAVNPMNTQSQMHESLQDNQYFSQRDMPDLKSVHYADTKASHKKQFNKTTVFEDELAPKKTKSGPYQKREPELTGEDKFAHLKIPEKKNQKPKTKMLKPSIRTLRNPLKKQSARQFDTLSKLEEADSKDTYSCDSESPLPVIPTPVSPDLKRFPKNQEKPVQRISKKRKFTSEKIPQA